MDASGRGASPRRGHRGRARALLVMSLRFGTSRRSGTSSSSNVSRFAPNDDPRPSSSLSCSVSKSSSSSSCMVDTRGLTLTGGLPSSPRRRRPSLRRSAALAEGFSALSVRASAANAASTAASSSAIHLSMRATLLRARNERSFAANALATNATVAASRGVGGAHSLSRSARLMTDSLSRIPASRGLVGGGGPSPPGMAPREKAVPAGSRAASMNSRARASIPPGVPPRPARRGPTLRRSPSVRGRWRATGRSRASRMSSTFGSAAISRCAPFATAPARAPDPVAASSSCAAHRRVSRRRHRL